MTDSLDTSTEADAAAASRLKEVLGDFFAEQVAGDAAWARAILGVGDEDS